MSALTSAMETLGAYAWMSTVSWSLHAGHAVVHHVVVAIVAGRVALDLTPRCYAGSIQRRTRVDLLQATVKRSMKIGPVSGSARCCPSGTACSSRAGLGDCSHPEPHPVDVRYDPHLGG